MKYSETLSKFIWILLICMKINSRTITKINETHRNAENILSKMDFSVNPCSDFYAYSCNKWIENNHIPNGETSVSTIGQIRQKNKYFMKDLFENPPNHNDRMLHNAIQYYRSCMNETLIEVMGFKTLYNNLKLTFGGWKLLPDEYEHSFQNDNLFDLTALHFPLITIFGKSPLFPLSTSFNRYNSSQPTLCIYAGAISLPKELYYNETGEALRIFMQTYSTILGVPKENLIEINEIYDFEKEIASLLIDRSERDMSEEYNVITLKELNKICPVINWNDLIQNLCNAFNYTVNEDFLIALEDTSSFIDRCALHANYSKTEEGRRKLHNSAVWSYLWRTRKVMPKVVQDALEELRRLQYGVESSVDRWETCAENVLTYYDSTIGRFHVNKYYDSESNQRLSLIIQYIRQSMDDIISNAKWMQQPDRIRAKLKLQNMENYFDHPNDMFAQLSEKISFIYTIDTNETDYLTNFLMLNKGLVLDDISWLLNVASDKWFYSSFVVNAAYEYSLNRIFVPVGISQPPLFNKQFPAAMNFGAIGTVIGHEITHAFDDKGSRFDQNGNLRSWWSKETRHNFEQSLLCLKQQYSNYTIQGKHLNGNLTIGENVADNGGVKAAYYAMRNYLKTSDERVILPGVNFTNDQLFFIAYAQMWCSKQLPETVNRLILLHVHSIPKFRIIGSLSNLPEFGNAFNCPINSPMNPYLKCRVW